MATYEERSGSWRAIVRRKGYPTQKKTFRLKADAQKWARMVEAEMDRGVFVSRSEAESTTLDALLDRYLTEVSINKKGFEQELSVINILKKSFLSKMTIAAIQSKHIAKYRDEQLKNGVSPETVKRRFVVLSNLYTTAIKEWSIAGIENQVAKVSIKTKKEGRERRLTKDEEQRLLDSAKNYQQTIYYIIQIALETSMRRAEISLMLWSDIDFNRKVIKVRSTSSKNEYSREIPMSKKCQQILSELNSSDKKSSDSVFNIKPKSITQAFIRICKRCGLVDLRFHDLRHEAVSRLFEKDFNIMEASSISGHRDLRMLKRYTHLKAENLLDKMG